jgi:hypothetical protein
MDIYENNKTKPISGLDEKQQRLKYVRYLEKFHKRTIPLLKHPKFDVEIFIKTINKYYEELKLIPAVRLDSSYLQMLENFVNQTLQYISNYDEQEDKDNFENQKQSLLKQSNLLHKEKNKSNYKKDKHKKKSFTDGY